MHIPSGVYTFDGGDFSVTAWINVKSYVRFMRIIEFANGPGNDNIAFNMVEKTPRIGEEIYLNYKLSSVYSTSNLIDLNKWYFVAFTFSKGIGSIYVNGFQVARSAFSTPNYTTRKSNFIGTHNWNFPYADQYAHAIFNEIKIYQGALTSYETFNEYNQNNYTIATTASSTNSNDKNKGYILIVTLYNF